MQLPTSPHAIYETLLKANIITFSPLAKPCNLVFSRITTISISHQTFSPEFYNFFIENYRLIKYEIQ